MKNSTLGKRRKRAGISPDFKERAEEGGCSKKTSPGKRQPPKRRPQVKLAKRTRPQTLKEGGLACREQIFRRRGGIEFNHIDHKGVGQVYGERGVLKGVEPRNCTIRLMMSGLPGKSFINNYCLFDHRRNLTERVGPKEVATPNGDRGKREG